MVMIKIMGTLDAVVAIIMLLELWDVSPWRLSLTAAFYLIFKGIAFRGSWMSTMDIAWGVYIILMMLGVHFFMTWVFLVYGVYKLFFSWFV
ncbi:hypothetical protein JW868_01200 [Candidatus Woesearchaeota archaeon]|nr:hypothetical protein [Candidatus Woesearchaeota archaeon]